MNEKIRVIDRRYPLFNGTWKRTDASKENKFATDHLYDEPHRKRKHVILQKYPKLKYLYGHDYQTLWITIFCVLNQILLAVMFTTCWKDVHWAYFVLTAFAVGGTITHMIGAILHETCHNLVCKTPIGNRITGMLANVCIPFPIAASFKRYHLEHHTWQGVEGKDPDLPIDAELSLIKGNWLLKILWMSNYAFLYVMRGAVNGKKPNKWEIYNWMSCIVTNYIILRYCGGRGLLYLFLSLYLGYGIHPGAAHFIAEHYSFEDGQETFSVYSPFNWIMLNLGFHNEHHDFVAVPWTRLPLITKIASDFYMTKEMKKHHSWLRVLWTFISSPQMGPQSRITRSVSTHLKARGNIVNLKKIIPEISLNKNKNKC